MESGEKRSPPAPGGEPRTGNAIRINLRTRPQVIHSANVIPHQHPAPGESRVKNIPKDDFFRASGAVIDLANDFFRLGFGTVVRAILQIFIKDQPTFTVIEHVNHDPSLAALCKCDGTTCPLTLPLAITC